MTQRVALVWLSLMSFPALAAEPACRRVDKTIVCSEEGFKTLTDMTVEYKAQASKLTLQVEADKARIAVLEQELAKKPQVAPVKLTKNVMGAAVAVVGAAAVATAIAVDMDTTARVGLGLSGLAAITTGFVVVVIP